MVNKLDRLLVFLVGIRLDIGWVVVVGLLTVFKKAGIWVEKLWFLSRVFKVGLFMG